MRADSGFWSWKMIDRLTTHQIGWSITVRLHQPMRAAIAGIDDDKWVDIDYTLGGRAQVAETLYTTGKGRRQRQVRLIVRRTRLTDTAQAMLWPDWRHHAFITSDHHVGMVEADRAIDAVDGEGGQRVGAQELAHALEILVGGEQVRVDQRHSTG